VFSTFFNLNFSCKTEYLLLCRLKKLYNSCARYVYNIRPSESFSVHAQNITGKTLDQLHGFRVCSFFHKIITQREPAYLWDKLRFGRSQRTGILIPPRHGYTERGNSFFVGGAGMWNSLSLEIRTASSAEAFKRSYFSHTSTQ
jgi:hypothetical protein